MAFNTASRWSSELSNKITIGKKMMANLSYTVRADQYHLFLKLLQPGPKTTIFDVGTTPNQTLKDSNFFEQVYPYPKQLVIGSVEDCRFLVKQYGLKHFVHLQPGKKLPYKKNAFDIVVSWATLEHVGDYHDQAFFLSELNRVGKQVFVTTPYKYCIYEPHTELFFIHWLPNRWLRSILASIGKSFWANVENWNTLSKRDVEKMMPKGFEVKIYSSLPFFPTHLIIFKKSS